MLLPNTIGNNSNIKILCRMVANSRAQLAIWPVSTLKAMYTKNLYSSYTLAVYLRPKTQNAVMYQRKPTRGHRQTKDTPSGHHQTSCTRRCCLESNLQIVQAIWMFVAYIVGYTYKRPRRTLNTTQNGCQLSNTVGYTSSTNIENGVLQKLVHLIHTGSVFEPKDPERFKQQIQVLKKCFKRRQLLAIDNQRICSAATIRHDTHKMRLCLDAVYGLSRL